MYLSPSIDQIAQTTRASTSDNDHGYFFFLVFFKYPDDAHFNDTFLNKFLGICVTNQNKVLTTSASSPKIYTNNFFKKIKPKSVAKNLKKIPFLQPTSTQYNFRLKIDLDDRSGQIVDIVAKNLQLKFHERSTVNEGDIAFLVRLPRK